jgi:8-oxo-dGTP diphosphatase
MVYTPSQHEGEGSVATGSRTGRIRVRVSALVIQKDRVLAVEHQKAHRRYWLLPGGGVEPGERLPAALVRECAEELGVVARPGPLVLVSDSIDLTGDRHIIQVTFLTEIDGEPKSTGSDPRVNSVAWLDAAQIRQAVFYPDIKEHILGTLHGGSSYGARYVAPEWR